jgi:two-component sensor histidine kinase
LGQVSKPPKKVSIVRRIMFMAWFVAIITAVVFAAATIYSQNRAIRLQLEANAVRVATAISADIQMAMTENEVQAASGGNGTSSSRGKKMTFPKITASPEELDYVVLATRPQKMLYLVGQELQPGEEPWKVAQLFGDIWFPENEDKVNEKAVVVDNPLPSIAKALHYREAFKFQGNLVGWIHVGISMEAYYASIQKVYSLTGMVTLSVIILSAVVSYFYAQQITKPIRMLQRYAQSVSAGSLNARVTLKSNDEIQDLGDSLNIMVENLQSSQHKMKDSLEAKQAMREQEVLLREIHHRVKNNMQILTSLLRLQTRQAKSEQLRVVLRESEARIRSMGLLHEKLYQSDSVSEIDFAGYLRTLTSELVRMNTPQGEKREIRLAVCNIKLGLDTALPCGLIVTELVSNSLKYAFPGPGHDGVILISLGRKQEGEYTLVVWDNGVGLPPDYKDRQTKSLGTRLVTMLTDQLNGTLTVVGQRGTRTEIRFKESQYSKRI